MYNSLPWEEDITRVYVLRPVGTSSSEGILLFPSKKKRKGNIWCIVEAPGGGFVRIFLRAWVYMHCGLGERENKMKS